MSYHYLVLTLGLLCFNSRESSGQPTALSFKKKATTNHLDANTLERSLASYNRLISRLKADRKVTINSILDSIDQASTLVLIKMWQDSIQNNKQQYLKQKGRLQVEIKNIEDQLYLSQTKGWFPASTSRQAASFYNLHNGSFSLMNDFTVQYSADPEVYSLYNELFSDFVGPVRLTVSGMVLRAPKLSEQGITSSMSRELVSQGLSSGGGNVIIGMEYPLYFVGSKNNSYGLRVLLQPKFGIYTPTLQINGETQGHSIEGGININGYIMSRKETFVMYFHSRSSISQFTIRDLEKQTEFGAFNQVTLGLDIKNTIRIGYSRTFTNLTSTKTDNNYISLSLNPHF